MGHECQIIDYRCPFIENHYYKFNLFSLIQIKRIIYTILYNGVLKKNTKGFQKFCEKYLKISNVKYDENTINNIENEYDLFITGSDQVWSPTCAGFDKNYFLNFVKNSTKKVSYAASFGVATIPDRFKDDYINLLQSFSHISVRERSGIDIVRKLIKKDATLVMDPTLLLSKQQWKEKLVLNKEKNKYILIYMISEDKNLIKDAKKFAKNRGLEVRYVHDCIYKTKEVVNLNKVSPNKWVELFYSAEYVFTNSFHGVAFSINFGKQFFVYELQQNTGVNERLYNILDIFNLKNRMVGSHEVGLILDYDVDAVQQILYKERSVSNQYLHSIVD